MTPGNHGIDSEKATGQIVPDEPKEHRIMHAAAAIHNGSDLTTHCRVGQHRWVSTYGHQAHLPTWTCQHRGEVKVKVADQDLFYVWASHR